MALIKTHIELDLGWLTTNPQIPYDEGSLLANTLIALSDSNDYPNVKIEFKDNPWHGTIFTEVVLDTYNDTYDNDINNYIEIVSSGNTGYIKGEIELESDDSNEWYYRILIKNPLILDEYVSSNWNSDSKIILNNSNYLINNNSYFIVEVKDAESDLPISNVNVTIIGAVRSATTRSDGIAIIPNIPIGIYNVSFQHGDYVNKTEMDFEIFTKNNVQLLEIEMTPVK